MADDEHGVEARLGRLQAASRNHHEEEGDSDGSVD